jgi:hypothetical protein
MITPKQQAQVETVAESIINGQFTQARQQSKGVSWRSLYLGFREFGWTEEESVKRANQMKNR